MKDLWKTNLAIFLAIAFALTLTGTPNNSGIVSEMSKEEICNRSSASIAGANSGVVSVKNTGDFRLERVVLNYSGEVSGTKNISGLSTLGLHRGEIDSMDKVSDIQLVHSSCGGKVLDSVSMNDQCAKVGASLNVLNRGKVEVINTGSSYINGLKMVWNGDSTGSMDVENIPVEGKKVVDTNAQGEISEIKLINRECGNRIVYSYNSYA